MEIHELPGGTKFFSPCSLMEKRHPPRWIMKGRDLPGAAILVVSSEFRRTQVCGCGPPIGYQSHKLKIRVFNSSPRYQVEESLGTCVDRLEIERKNVRASALRSDPFRKERR